LEVAFGAKALMNDRIAHHLQARRLELDLSGAELPDRIGISEGEIKLIEDTLIRPSTAAIVTLCAALDVRVSSIFSGLGTRPTRRPC
jgi:transcriptional regulator with XRE-family HTH domain